MSKTPYYLLLLVTLLLAGCQAPVKEEDIFNVPFSVIDSGDYSHLTLAKELVIRDNKQWKYLWLAHTGDPRKQPPRVNFHTEMVMAFFLGERPTSGYSIHVQRIRVVHDQLLVELTVHYPDPHRQHSMALTQAHTIIKLPSYGLPVKFLYRQIR